MAKRFFGRKARLENKKRVEEASCKVDPKRPKPELMAPAGDLVCAHAALDFGADSIYLGLKKFSARAEAGNFTLAELSEVIAYAHSLKPRRKVYVALNTIIFEDELSEIIEILAQISDLEVDAVIVQDLGLAKLAREHFPELRLHASTQMAIHNLEGALVAKKLGFSRATLARELTFEEVEDIAKNCGIETEVFVHGALCYSYSGLCQFSSRVLGKSGNRGECRQPCRELFEVKGTAQNGKANEALPFSMKDLYLGKHMEDLRALGATSLKIEGRKKSPLYVAAVTDFYRKLIDGRLLEKQVEEFVDDLKTIYSRPWTDLYAKGRFNREVIDTKHSGHQGLEIGKVEKLILPKGRPHKIRFRTARALERHDGLQIQLPYREKPYGFSVEFSAKPRGGSIYSAPAGSWVEVLLPKSHPKISKGAKVFCSASQAVKRKYLPLLKNPGNLKVRRKIDVKLTLSKYELDVHARVNARYRWEEDLLIRRQIEGEFDYAKDPKDTKTAIKAAFSQFGETNLELNSFEFHNPFGLFVPVSQVKHLRREISDLLEKALAKQKSEHIANVARATQAHTKRPKTAKPKWSLKVGDPHVLDLLGSEQAKDIEELIVEVSGKNEFKLAEALGFVEKIFGRQKIRLALPIIMRSWEREKLCGLVEGMVERGYRKWQVSNLYGFLFLENCGQKVMDISADWPLYVANHLAADCLSDLGADHVTSSIEGTQDNQKKLAMALAGRVEFIAYQDTPLFISENCPTAALSGKCPGKDSCDYSQMALESKKLGKVLAINNGCRTTVILGKPYRATGYLRELSKMGASRFRLDFINRKYSPEEVVKLFEKFSQISK